MDWDIEAEVSLGSRGVLSFDRGRRILAYAEEGREPSEISVGEADLRNWMQVLLLSSFAPTSGERAPELATRLVLELARAHVHRGEDPFTPLRARLRRIAGTRPPRAG
jgi:hypothetical protein